jgi:antibiotic biosynthesis monooxygenase (ABM) superfamily enzyme
MKTNIKLMNAFKIWVVIYPSITLFLYLFGDLMQAWPLAVKTLVITLVLVPWVVFVGLPFVNSIMGIFTRKK